jgi:hypothetical protein
MRFFDAVLTYHLRLLGFVSLVLPFSAVHEDFNRAAFQQHSPHLRATQVT